MHIAIAFDENYLTPVYALLTSIFDNNKNEAILIHAIATGLAANEQQELQEYAKVNGSAIQYYDIEESFGRDFVLPPTLWWTASIYYRLLFPLVMAPDITRFIYLDTDIIVLGKLRSLYTIDMQNLPVAAVRDFVDARPELGIFSAGNYFNSGVLLIDRTEWLARDVTNKAIEFIRNNADILVYPDQDALNATLVDSWCKLDSRFNRMFPEIPKDQPRKKLKSILDDTVILHYTTQHKPWSMLGENRLRNLYFRYLKKVPAKYRRRYDDFSWNRHKIRRMFEIRLNELFVDYPALIFQWRKT
ncbi:glycosyltransferase family 8 protein [Hymenobacter puniceus]|uniref:glycosyltransferase family 8 protein n=1 Tax=Hymenobacter sp. BT190 TaxID=2763505 RepID=UPI0016512AA5|nr:glycosyltransferase family 8 protein [Hymenobacter sp. BT190]MBC6697794.1 glycosyltransferase family 8 protein [Hymenobacter sp. BT190]